MFKMIKMNLFYRKFSWVGKTSFNVDKQGDAFTEKWFYLEDTKVQESFCTKRRPEEVVLFLKGLMDFYWLERSLHH